ncbi:MAG: hypothetical protein E4H33_02760 [Anaerolineales bacterium]|nr:MAG: hypothetical protein E4H33_02760 [Anaerolineales bacterium]
MRIYPRYGESGQIRADPLDVDKTAQLVTFSWDWVEYLTHPLPEIQVQSINWVPGSGVICGENTITNQSSNNREITLDSICHLQPQGDGSRMSREGFKGREVLTGQWGTKEVVFFQAGNPIQAEGPYPFLSSSLQLKPGDTKSCRWICVMTESKQSAFNVLERTIQLDWAGEISRRRIREQSQLQITNGDPDWDFALALSLKQGRLFLEQLKAEEEQALSISGRLSPFLANYLFQVLTPLNADGITNILEMTFQSKVMGNSYNKTSPGLQAGTTHSLPLGAELIWQVHQAGFPKKLWEKYLPAAASWLQEWFVNELDQDADGVPDLVHPDIFSLADLKSRVELPLENRVTVFPYLESPGLSAILSNEFDKLEKLEKICRIQANGAFLEKKKALDNHLKESWQAALARFQMRDSVSHIPVIGGIIQTQLQPGFTRIQQDLPQPSRLGLVFTPNHARKALVDPSIVLHGSDWQGNYRIEEIHQSNIHWEVGWGWTVSESIYSRLDYCLLQGFNGEVSVDLLSPSLTREDISLTLPLWANALSPGQAEDLINKNLTHPDKYWSKYGLRSYPEPGASGIQLPWNLFLGQGLLTCAKQKLAADLISCWMGTILINLKKTGSFYSIYDADTGFGLGQENTLEGLFPVRFFLQVLGIQFIEGTLILENSNPFPWPVTITYRGLVIHREKDKTIINIQGKEHQISTSSEKQYFQLGDSASTNFSTW